MDLKEFRKVAEARRNAPPQSPLELTRKFLGIYFADADGMDEVQESLQRRVTANPLGTVSYLEAIEKLLGDPPDDEGVLAEMVAWDANWGLDDPSDEGAKQWLGEVAAMLREVLSKEQATRLKK